MEREWREREERGVERADGRLEREGDGALGFGDYLDAGLPVAKSATNPYTTTKKYRVPMAGHDKKALYSRGRELAEGGTRRPRSRPPKKRWQGQFFSFGIFCGVFGLPSPRNAQKCDKKIEKKSVLDFLSIFCGKLFDTIVL
jgi:hypothetical protein